MLIGEKIRELRKKSKMSLVELNKSSGVALATLSRIETGRMTGTIESHMNIAKIFGLSLAELYKDVNLDKEGQSKKETPSEDKNTAIKNLKAKMSQVQRELNECFVMTKNILKMSD